jgi:NADPH:quinone reductase
MDSIDLTFLWIRCIITLQDASNICQADQESNGPVRWEIKVRAVQVERAGGPEELRVIEREPPVPGPHDVLIRVVASGVNFIDIYVREGRYGQTLPLTPGQEGAGVIVETGSAVRGVTKGNRVAWCSILGTYAEFAVAPADRVVPIPKELSFEEAAAVLLQGMTAHYLSHSVYAIKAGDEVLIHAGAGGTGLLLTQFAKSLGARVYTTVSTKLKAELSRAAGADEVIQYTQHDFRDEIQRLTSGRGVAAVYDSVGATTFERSLSCLIPRGTMVLYGSASGEVQPFAPIALAPLGSLFLTRPVLRDYVATQDELRLRATAVFDAVSRGTLKVRIEKAYPLESAREAHEALYGRKTIGKLILVP